MPQQVVTHWMVGWCAEAKVLAGKEGSESLNHLITDAFHVSHADLVQNQVPDE